MEKGQDYEIDRKTLSPRVRKFPQSFTPVSKRQHFSAGLANSHHRSLAQATKEAVLVNQGEELIIGKKSKSNICGSNEILNKPRLGIYACHICRRKPTQTNEMETYTDCERCLERTCTICMRRCIRNKQLLDQMTSESGSKAILPLNSTQCGGHCENICSRCCIEKGIEGEIWCLGCLNTGM